MDYSKRLAQINEDINKLLAEKKKDLERTRDQSQVHNLV